MTRGSKDGTPEFSTRWAHQDWKRTIENLANNPIFPQGSRHLIGLSTFRFASTRSVGGLRVMVFRLCGHCPIVSHTLIPLSRTHAICPEGVAPERSETHVRQKAYVYGYYYAV